MMGLFVDWCFLPYITITSFEDRDIVDVDFEDITDIQEDEAGEEAYCVPI